MPSAETRRETFPAALQGKGKEPADDNDSRMTGNAAAVADTDLSAVLQADADAAAGSRDSQEMVDACGSGDLEDGGREAAEPMGVEVRTLCVKTFCCGAIHVHTYFTLALYGHACTRVRRCLRASVVCVLCMQVHVCVHMRIRRTHA